jgi:Cdc6-like AAA superfamily ATPase
VPIKEHVELKFKEEWSTPALFRQRSQALRAKEGYDLANAQLFRRRLRHIIIGLIALNVLLAANILIRPPHLIDISQILRSSSRFSFLVLTTSVSMFIFNTLFRLVEPVWPFGESAQDDLAAFAESVRAELEKRINLIANAARALPPGEIFLTVGSGTNLVEIDAAKVVRLSMVKECWAFVSTHVTSAIGISGPRGVGKTTIMREVTTWTSKEFPLVGVYIPAPVKYADADFVRTIHQLTAEAVLESFKSGAGQYTTSNPPDFLREGFGNRKVWIGTILVVLAGVLMVKGFEPSSLKWWRFILEGLALCTGALLLLLAVFSTFRAWSLQTRTQTSPTGLASAELQRLQWSSKTQRTVKSSLSIKPITVEGSGMVELSERDSAHSDRVRQFRSFTRRYWQLTEGKRPIVIAIDELDKLSEVDDALNVVNGLKDLMHGVGVHFLVSVSEDALARFALRGIALRDAFDSTFDTIKRVTPLRADESLNLLRERVFGLPDVLAYFCHALSGGLPRDLIRFARLCINEKPEDTQRVATQSVVRSVARNHVLSLLDAALVRGRAAPTASTTLLDLLEVKRSAQNVGDSTDNFCDLLERAAEFLAKASANSDAADAVTSGLPVALATIGTICRYFGRSWKSVEWHNETDHDIPSKVADEAAKCTADWANDPIFTVQRLNELRASMQPSQRALDLGVPQSITTTLQTF